jgi:hypothetical protein
MKLRLEHSGVLYMQQEESDEIEVQLKQCFPWSKPGELLSFRDKEGKEVYLLNNLSNLSEVNRAVIEEYLKVIQFVIEIKSINNIEEDVELRFYDVETQSGRRVFQTKLEDWPKVAQDGRVIIGDLAGDLYLIQSLLLLDQKSLAKISPYVS